MSSTNRGYNRHKTDYYITPQKDIKLFLDNFLEVEDLDLSKLKILDPCSGGDSFNNASYVEVLSKFNPLVLDSIDIREDSKAETIANFLEVKKEDLNNYDIIISNPPFYLAEEFIKKALSIVESGAFVIMLLRLNFFGSKKRKLFFEENFPIYTFIHHKRIRFIEGKSTDSIEYAHFVFKKGYKENYSKTFLI